MSKEMYIYFYILLFVIVFLVTYIMDLLKIRRKKQKKIGEIQYLVNKFNLDINKINYKKSCFVIAIINAFIISSVTIFISFVDMIMTLQLLLGFILLFALIYSLYEIYGRILVKKGYTKKKVGKK
jgi:hypothetical protein